MIPSHRERFTMTPMARAAMSTLPDQLSAPDTHAAKGNKIMTNQANSGTSAHGLNTARNRDSTSAMKDFKLQELTMLSIAPIFRVIRRWWLQRAEHHYLICADVEEQRAREAHMNVAYYQKRAALVRSALHY